MRQAETVRGVATGAPHGGAHQNVIVKDAAKARSMLHLS